MAKKTKYTLEEFLKIYDQLNPKNQEAVLKRLRRLVKQQNKKAASQKAA